VHPAPTYPGRPADLSLRLENCRQLAWTDVAAVTALSESCVEADAVAPLSDRVARRLHHRHSDPDRHLLVLSTDGPGPDEVVGYAHVGPAPDGPGNSVEVLVHPSFRGRGIGRLLLRSARRESPGEQFRLIAPQPTPAACALARSLGLTTVRPRHHMVLRLSPVRPARLPADRIRVRAFDPEHDEPGWQALYARIIRARPQVVPWTIPELNRRKLDSWFDPDGLFVAEGDSVGGGTVLLGFAWATVHQDGRPQSNRNDTEPVIGHLHLGEVVPSTDASVIHEALAHTAVRWLDVRGVTTVITSTEDRSDGATAVLRRIGFRDHHTDTVFSPGTLAGSAPG
jgi:mycothiol synthase